jgi:acyl-coenzyme A synthetase/AMP-(fatty) acid ligase
MNVIARRALAQLEAPAIIGDTTATYSVLMQQVVSAASRLAEEGVKRGDVVGIAAHGLPGQVLLTLAVAYAGAVSLPIGAAWSREEAEAARACGMSFIVHNGHQDFRVDALYPGRQISLRELKAAQPRTTLAMTRSEPGEPFRIGFSSGTTGRPKAIKFTHESMLLRTQLIRTVFPGRPGERTMIGIDPSLHFAVGYWLHALMCGGAAVGSLITGPAVMEAVRQQKANMLMTSPAVALELLKIAQSQPTYGEPAPDLHTMCIGGARVSPHVQALFRKHLCPNVVINYGMTEAGGLVAQADAEVAMKSPASAGRLMPWVEAEAVDDAGTPLPSGMNGRLRVRSPYLASGYVGADGPDADAFRDGWFYSGDVGMVTPDGLVYIGARADVLNLGGVKVAADRIEHVIAEDTAILECVALTLPDQAQQPQLFAVVVAPQGLDHEALHRRCVAQLGAGLAPKLVLIVDRLPRNAGGKILRQEVAALVLQHLATRRTAPSTPG